MTLNRSGAVARVGTATVAGVAAALSVTALFHQGRYAPAVGWVVAAAVFLGWTWRRLWPMTADQTHDHANDWDSSKTAAHRVVLFASLAGLAGVGYLLWGKTFHDFAAALVGVLSVTASWFAIHSFFTLRYARIYYQSARAPVNFGDQPPTYHDFAYMAFTVGMTYQVSDTDIRTTEMRRAVLAHALLSFGMGAIILAIVLNLVASLTG